MGCHLGWYFTVGCSEGRQRRINTKRATGPPETIKKKRTVEELHKMNFSNFIVFLL
jgi:hypothetical protein